MFAALIILATLAVGYFNGANDVSKSIATLVGSGVTRYRTAVLWGGVWTFVGAETAAWASRGLVAAFSGKGVLAAQAAGEPLLLATALGALGWIWLATRGGLPVSTTHALTGALVGAGVAAFGWSGINGGFLLAKFALPLVVGPVLATALVWVAFPLLHRTLVRWQGYCVCVQKPQLVACGEGVACVSPAPPALVTGASEDCGRTPAIVANLTLADGLHWLSAGATAFARGLNDAPKVLGLGIAAAMLLSIPIPVAFTAVAAAMTAGSLLRGLRVTETLAQKVTRMDPLEGLTANLVTAGLVVFASHLALPVSTTHVSTGAIIGLGLKQDARRIQWKTVRELGLAWILTLPFAALVAALSYWLLRQAA
ncbi:MAG: inorganic phosphate transporter [Opitutae bacterium]|nr:inorganic phosphate transporter [Opitutae bacterium]